MQITLNITHKEAEAMREIIIAALALADKSPNIGTIIGVNVTTRKIAMQVVAKLPEPITGTLTKQ